MEAYLYSQLHYVNEDNETVEESKDTPIKTDNQQTAEEESKIIESTEKVTFDKLKFTTSHDEMVCISSEDEEIVANKIETKTKQKKRKNKFTEINAKKAKISKTDCMMNVRKIMKPVYNADCLVIDSDSENDIDFEMIEKDEEQPIIHIDSPPHHNIGRVCSDSYQIRPFEIYRTIHKPKKGSIYMSILNTKENETAMMKKCLAELPGLT